MADVTDALRETENALRDFIASSLEKKHGSHWLVKSGVSKERIAIWEGRQHEEGKKQGTLVVDDRLIYYADFYDLRTLLEKNWEGDFFEAFGKWRRFEVLLTSWLASVIQMRTGEICSRIKRTS